MVAETASVHYSFRSLVSRVNIWELILANRDFHFVSSKKVSTVITEGAALASALGKILEQIT